MSRNRNKRRARVSTHGSVALLERREPQENVIPIAEAKGKRTGGAAMPKAISLAWGDTEALGITADMRRSGPGMLSDQDRKETLYQAYLNSVWISACVDVIAKRITSGGMVIELTEKGTENQTEYDTLHDFLHYINDDEDFLQLIRSIATDLLIYGEAYLEIVSKAGVPYSLHKIDCSTMNYTLDKHGTVTQYIQNMNHSMDSVIFEPEEVIRFWLPDPKAQKKALSPIERILGSVDADAHMADWVRAFFRKGARPPFWIEFPGSKDEASRFVVWLRENYTGQSNAHVPMVLYDGAKLNEIGKGSVDMDFSKGRGMMRQEILAGYQVPPAIVSQIESGNIGGGTGESQDKSFQFNACDPIRQLIFEKFNFRITQKGFKINNWRVSTRYADFRSDDAVAALQDKRIRNASNTVNEVRAEMGKPPLEGGDTPVFAVGKEVLPLERLAEMAGEGRQQTQLAIQQSEAQLEMTNVQIDKAKNPPPPPPTMVQAPPDNKKADEQQERYLLALQQSMHRVNETLARADEHLRIARNASTPDEESVMFQQTLINELQRFRDQESASAEYLKQELETVRSLIEEKQEIPMPVNQSNGMVMLAPDEEANAYYGGYKAQQTPPFDEQRIEKEESFRVPLVNQPRNAEELMHDLDLLIQDAKKGNYENHATAQDETTQEVASDELPIQDALVVDGIPDREEYQQESELDTLVEDNRPEVVQHHTGTMIALKVDMETATQLAIPGGEPAEEMHITLCYMGKTDKEAPEGKLHPAQTPDTIKPLLSALAMSTEPLQGVIGGLARFIPSDSSDWKSPVIALVNVQGLQQWRQKLVDVLDQAGYFVAANFDYTPHISITYVEPDAPMPINEIPALPLNFYGIELCIGDDVTYFPFGDNNDQQTTPTQSTESNDVTTRTHEDESNRTLYPLQEPDSEGDSGTASTDVGDATSESSNTEEASRDGGSVEEDEKPKETPPEQHWQESDSETLKTLAELEKKGVTHLTWKAHQGACEDCMKNDKQKVPLMKPFKSGAMMAPEHGNCACETVEGKE